MILFLICLAWCKVPKREKEKNELASEGRHCSQIKTLHKSHSANGCCTQLCTKDTNTLKINASHLGAKTGHFAHLEKWALPRQQSNVSISSALKAKLQGSCCSGNSNTLQATDYYRDINAKILQSLIAIISVHCSLVVRAADNNTY